MKIYHYSNIRDWTGIQKGSWKSDDLPGLGAGKRIGHEDPEAWKTGALFGLLEPMPDTWVKNQTFKNVWEFLRSNIGELLLEIDVDPEKDKVFVMERGHMEGFLYKDKNGIPDTYLHPTRKDSERAYMKSMIPLKEYMEKEKELNYSVPEVVFLEHIPLEKIKISEQQPLLERELEKYSKGDFRDGFIREIQAIPELASWYERYTGSKELQKEISPIKLK